MTAVLPISDAQHQANVERYGEPAVQSPRAAPVRLDAFLAGGADTTAADWVLPGLFAPEVVTGIAGKPKAGKTTCLLHAAYCIAEGMPFCRWETRQTNVLWLNLETSTRLARFKLRAVAGTAASEHFYILNGTRDDAHPERVAEWVRELGAGLVVVDSLSKWWAVAEENSNSEIDKATDPAVRLARAAGCGVVLIHHSRKNRTGGETPLDMFRGGSALTAALDIGILFTKAGKEDPALRRLELESRYDETPGELYVRLGPLAYDRIDDPAGLREARQADGIGAVLTATPATVDALMELLPEDFSAGRETVNRRLRKMVEEGRALVGPKDGKAYTYCRGPKA